MAIPLTSFFDDNSFLNGGNGLLDASSTGNGGLVNVVVAIVSASGDPVSFRTDQWTFEGAPDGDGDGVIDGVDNCLARANADQFDTDEDGYGNACDADINNDCIVNASDLAALRLLFFTTSPNVDFNGDGVVNSSDLAIMREAFFEAPGPSGTTATCAP